MELCFAVELSLDMQQSFSNDFSLVWMCFRIVLSMEAWKYSYGYSEALIFHPTFSQCAHVSEVL